MKNSTLSIFTRVLAAIGILFTISCTQHSDLTTELDEIVEAHDIMGGAVIVFGENELMDAHYFGKADLERDIPVNQDTKFRIASISKTITAIALMQLVEQGRLDLDADISEILGYKVQNPHFPEGAVTVKMLLSHTSSIVDGKTYSPFLQASVNQDSIPDLGEILRSSGSFYDSTQFYNAKPGTYFYYSNLNYVILGTIIEKISNQRFDRYCLQNIFQPLGIDASFNLNDLQNIDELAVLYRKKDGQWLAQADNHQGIQPELSNLENYQIGTNGARFGPQGSLRCSPKDLAQLFMCLFGQDPCPILSSESLSNMIADHWTYNGSNGNHYDGLFRSWGLGIHRITSTPAKDEVFSTASSMYGHPGEAYGLVSDLYYDPTSKVGIVFMNNGVGEGYHIDSTSAFYTVEKDVFEAVEHSLK